MEKNILLISIVLSFLSLSSSAQDKSASLPASRSGIYPSLAYSNSEGECGTGAVVPWADRLWVVTYGPHCPFGSDDKLYEITPNLQIIPHSESIGGTHANRFIHLPSSQLFIGPYVVDRQRNVRVIGNKVMPGRLTGTCMSVADPNGKVMMATMEQGFYEVDVNTLNVRTLSKDGNQLNREGAPSIHGTLCIGTHGKGFYSGQGVYVYTNNGEGTKEALSDPTVPSGSLSEYDGTVWKTIRRNQFTEATGPSGIQSSDSPDTDPIWSVGWDNKSLILAVRHHQSGWSFFRLPKASHAYDGAHGWNTEWPRIRDIGEWDGESLLMTMHGMFWQFPKTFTAATATGIRPLSAYLKVIADFAKWNEKIVFGCDDTAKNEFMNRRPQKSTIPAPMQSCSNLWFTDLNTISHLGSTHADGAVWQDDHVEAGQPSEPMLIAGWKHRQLWIANKGTQDVNFRLEVDKQGNGQWTTFSTIGVKAGTSTQTILKKLKGEWIRIVTDKATTASVIFTFSPDEPGAVATQRYNRESQRLFRGLAPAGARSSIGGKLYNLGGTPAKMGVYVNNTFGSQTTDNGYYTLNTALKLVPSPLHNQQKDILEKLKAKPTGATLDSLSILIIDERGRRWRLPIADDHLARLSADGQTRICREVVTERDLFHFGGTFFELPAENADGFAKIRPIASHHYRIDDYASYCGMLVMTGVDINVNGNGNGNVNGNGNDNGRTKNDNERTKNIIHSADNRAAVWTGAIDDLWKIGRPTGHASLWRQSKVAAGEKSDPLLVGFYDRKTVTITNHSHRNVTFALEADPNGNGQWMTYTLLTVKAGKTVRHKMPEGFSARWLRIVAQSETVATVNVDCGYRQPAEDTPLPENPSLIGRGVMVVSPHNYSRAPGAQTGR